jgi:hypothetical protein
LEALASCRVSWNATEGEAQTNLEAYTSLKWKFVGTGAAFLGERAARLMWMVCGKRNAHFPLDA